tara:strand:- start:236 stop:712 length:477 start_codon:yes stop_codon:yes gene_type:complete
MKKIALTVRTAIERALEKFNLPNDEAIVRLLLMISAHESRGFVCCKQLNGGPAIGLFQMEPNTFDFVQGYLTRTNKFPLISRSMIVERLLIDVEFAAAMARVYLWTEPTPLPDADDLQGLAEYASKFWNRGGKGEPHEYLNDFLTHVWGEPILDKGEK